MNEPLRIRVPATPPTGGPTSDDTSIPLLTERLTAPATLPPLDLDITLPPSAQTVRLDLPLTDTPSPAAPASTEGTHWSRIEIELRESVLRTLAEQLPQNIEEIVARHVSAATDAAVRAMVEPLIERLAADARLALASSLRDIVDRAVKSELARMRAMRSR